MAVEITGPNSAHRRTECGFRPYACATYLTRSICQRSRSSIEGLSI